MYKRYGICSAIGSSHIRMPTTQKIFGRPHFRPIRYGLPTTERIFQLESEYRQSGMDFSTVMKGAFREFQVMQIWIDSVQAFARKSCGVWSLSKRIQMHMGILSMWFKAEIHCLKLQRIFAQPFKSLPISIRSVIRIGFLQAKCCIFPMQLVRHSIQKSTRFNIGTRFGISQENSTQPFNRSCACQTKSYSKSRFDCSCFKSVQEQPLPYMNILTGERDDDGIHHRLSSLLYTLYPNS